MKIQVIEVQKDGKTMYVRGVSMLDEEPLTENPALATNYAGNESQLQRDLVSISCPEDQIYAKSGLRVDAPPQLVEFEIQAVELSRKLGREPRKAPGLPRF